MRKLTIGQMAKLNNVSERALRIYHELGLLVPIYVDQTTAYRFYSVEQSIRLNVIIQLKSVGLSLTQIKKLMKNKNIIMLEAELYRQLNEIDCQLKQLKQKEYTLNRMLNTCKNFLNPPRLGSIFIEYQPERKAYYFDIPAFNYEEYSPDSNIWEQMLILTKSMIHRYGMPATFFSNIGCIIKQQNISNNKIICDGAFILQPDSAPIYPDVSSYIIKAGIYISLFDQWISGDTLTEAERIKKLLNYIVRNNMTICGDYIAEVVSESIIFNPDRHVSLIKMQIPVSEANM